jgi:hypothetical protein
MGNGFLSPMPPEVYDPATGAWTVVADPGDYYSSATLLPDGTVLVAGGRESPAAKLYDAGTASWTTTGSMFVTHTAPLTRLLDGTVLMAGGGPDGAKAVAELYVPAGVAPPPAVAALPSPIPALDPTPTPVPTASPTPLPPQAGPVPPDARPWSVTVMNRDSRPATLFVAEETEEGLLGRLVGSVTPNVVPPETTMEVTFLLPATGETRWLIFVNPGPNDGALLAETDLPLAGQILITVGGEPAWGR